ncbi:protein SHQ1 homolog isoform X3 [Poecilia formosa]|uniref:protein SHQ1 homolog isoform X3 n=1 Tax=Poecilia formosa TaxID=48698 RepID=UPI0007B98C20|nr:PREDICTED: protein SHQ1 homolog isoform X3 [Poecilia formosa]
MLLFLIMSVLVLHSLHAAGRYYIMITPAFDLSQDPDYLTICIRVPYTRTSEFDLFIDGADFKFYAKPYFLRLSLPGRIVEDGTEKATFDIDKGVFTLKAPKETRGEHFGGLQMLTSLLAPKGSRSAKLLVEDMSAETGSETTGDGEEEEDEEEFDWQLEQEVYTDRSEEKLGTMQKYGFANQRSGVFGRLQEELSDVIDVKNPEETLASERRRARLEAEALAFSSDHYLADLFEDDEINRLVKFTPWWSKLSPSTEQKGESAVSFSDEEKEQLRKFTNRSFLLDKTSRCQAWLSLLDILLAYSYEVRSAEGEHNTYSCLRDVLVSFGRRVLCYPLYRHFALVALSVCDTAKILQSGKACVLKCLLDIHKVFRENDPAYILNDLYITDYCIWIQRVSSKKMLELASMLQHTLLQKKDLELELDELESAARIVVEEEEQASTESSSSDSSSESEESEAEEQGCSDSKQGGGETCKDSPSEPSSSPSSPIPVLSSIALSPSVNRKAGVESSDSQGHRQLIQDLGRQMTEEMRISADSCSFGAGEMLFADE